MSFSLYGSVVVLVGPSCAGKSSIQKEFQQLMIPSLWIKLGIDSLFDQVMPNIIPENMHVWSKQNNIRWIEQLSNDQDQPIIRLHVGKDGIQVVKGMHRSIAEYAKAGCNVIVDYIPYDIAWLDDFQKQLSGLKVYWVKIDISLQELERREKVRGTSPVGHARSHYDYVYDNIEYDLVVNTEQYDAKSCAQEVVKLIS